ncbi:uncharacterized protein PG986_008441 [Apiospora aurea]|uniref:Uncharacterized protein n=1 Tax=Apiospora aurea TaxID=335848 RepID=A0ABR1QFS3_9PEZI
MCYQTLPNTSRTNCVLVQYSTSASHHNKKSVEPSQASKPQHKSKTVEYPELPKPQRDGANVESSQASDMPGSYPSGDASTSLGPKPSGNKPNQERRFVLYPSTQQQPAAESLEVAVRMLSWVFVALIGFIGLAVTFCVLTQVAIPLTLENFQRMSIVNYEFGRLRKVGETFRDVRDMATKRERLAEDLSQEMDHMAYIRHIVRQSSLPDPRSILDAVDQLEVHAHSTTRKLRSYFPNARNCGHLLEMRVPVILKNLEEVQQEAHERVKGTILTRWFWALVSGYDETRAMEMIKQDFTHLLDEIIRRTTELRSGSGELLLDLGELGGDIRLLRSKAESNRIRIGQDEAEMSQKNMLVRVLWDREAMRLIEEGLANLEELHRVIEKGSKAIKALPASIETIQSELREIKAEAQAFRPDINNLREVLEFLTRGTNDLRGALNGARVPENGQSLLTPGKVISIDGLLVT